MSSPEPNNCGEKRRLAAAPAAIPTGYKRFVSLYLARLKVLSSKLFSIKVSFENEFPMRLYGTPSLQKPHAELASIESLANGFCKTIFSLFF